MNFQRYIEQQIYLGYSLHQHDGVWWQQQSQFHCKPVFFFQKFPYGASRPIWYRSTAGYSHLVPDGETFNSIHSVLMLQWDSSNLFDISDLSYRRRSIVRRGQKKNSVHLITELEPLLESIRQIVISTRSRTGVGNPISYYFNHYNKWRNDMLKSFEMDDRYWWGAFVDEQLVAYFHTIYLENTLTILAAKSHSDFLYTSPNDTILFNIMKHAFNELGCQTINYGDYSETDEKLLYFKQSYGFKKYEFPEYIHLNPISRPLLNLRRSMRKSNENKSINL